MPLSQSGKRQRGHSGPQAQHTCALSTTPLPWQAKNCLSLPEILYLRVALQTAKMRAVSRVQGESYSGFVSGVGPGQPETAVGCPPGTGGLHSRRSNAWQPALLAPNGSRRGQAAFVHVSLPTHMHTQSQAQTVHQMSQCLPGQLGMPVKAQESPRRGFRIKTLWARTEPCLTKDTAAGRCPGRVYL